MSVMPDGVYPDLDERVYHADPALGSTDCKALLESPKLFLWQRENPIESPSMALGSAVHSLVLGGPEVALIDPDIDETEDAILARGGIPLDEVAATKAAAMARSVLDDLDSALVTSPTAKRELSVFATVDGVRCKARIDAHHLGGVEVDLKTKSGKVTTRAIRRAVHDYSYDVQAGHYVDVLTAAGLPVPEEFLLLFVSSDPPHLARPVSLSPASIERGRRLAAKARRTWLDCTTSRTWPAREPGIAVIHPFPDDLEEYL